jgi:hypothetical protein
LFLFLFLFFVFVFFFSPFTMTRSEAEVEELLREMQDHYLASVDDIMRQNASLRDVAARIADQRARASVALQRAYAARPELAPAHVRDADDPFAADGDDGSGTARGRGARAPAAAGGMAEGDVLALVEVVLGLAESDVADALLGQQQQQKQSRASTSAASSHGHRRGRSPRRRREAGGAAGAHTRNEQLLGSAIAAATAAGSGARAEESERLEALVIALEGADRSALIAELRGLAARCKRHGQEIENLNDRHSAERATLAGIIDRCVRDSVWGFWVYFSKK